MTLTRTSAEGLFELEDERPETLFALCDELGIGDGLPVVAPTPERVDAMLAGAGGSRDPDEVLAVLPPRSGVLTRRLLAINAVLAGCQPQWLPVLEAAARALARPELNLRGVNATTHPVAPLLIVHGPEAGRLGFNRGGNAFGPGNRANATVGRAVRLILINVAGANPGAGDAATQGQPSKYAYCVAENADASPWGAYHHSIGVDAPDAVTIHCGENPHNFHDMESDQPARLLDKAASAIATLGCNNAPISDADIFVVLCPEHAATIAAAGWGRGDIQAYLFERARLPAGVFRAAFDQALWPAWIRALADDELQPITARPDNYRIIVVGGPGKHSAIIPSWGVTRSVTEPIHW